MGLTERELCPKWYALAVKHQHERSAGEAFQSKGFETLVPLYRTTRRWSDRVRETDLPLFAGYVFCRFEYHDRVALLKTPGVWRIVGFGGTPTPIEDDEISAIQTMVESKVPIGPWPYLKPGDRVKVERGPLRGLEGTILREKDIQRLVISVELLRRSIAAEISPDAVIPCRA